jgi:hypothetical protein
MKAATVHTFPRTQQACTGTKRSAAKISTPSAFSKAALRQATKLTLTFFENSRGAPVADLHLGERRLLATTHPATIVAAIFVMGLTELEVVTAEGSHVGEVVFQEPGTDFWPMPAINLRLQLNPRLYQFRHLAPAASFVPLLEGLDLFAHENWYNPTELADEHLRAAHHHLPKDLIKRPLETPDPKGWKKTLARRNGWVYFPFC